jgi:transcriptional regulator with XRE-family HTH domain
VFRHKPIGAPLRSAREKKHLTQVDVACARGVAQATVSMLEDGVLPPRLSSLYDQAAIVGADIEAINRELLSILPSLRAARHPLVDQIETELLSRVA